MKEFLNYSYEGVEIYGGRIDVSAQNIRITGGTIVLHKKYNSMRGEESFIHDCLINQDGSDVAKEWWRRMTLPVL